MSILLYIHNVLKWLKHMYEWFGISLAFRFSILHFRYNLLLYETWIVSHWTIFSIKLIEVVVNFCIPISEWRYRQRYADCRNHCPLFTQQPPLSTIKWCKDVGDNYWMPSAYVDEHSDYMSRAVLARRTWLVPCHVMYKATESYFNGGGDVVFR